MLSLSAIRIFVSEAPLLAFAEELDGWGTIDKALFPVSHAYSPKVMIHLEIYQILMLTSAPVLRAVRFTSYFQMSQTKLLLQDGKN